MISPPCSPRAVPSGPAGGNEPARGYGDERAEFENSAADEEDDGGFVMFLMDVTDSNAPNGRMSECHEAAVESYGGECVNGRSS